MPCKSVTKVRVSLSYDDRSMCCRTQILSKWRSLSPTMAHMLISFTKISDGRRELRFELFSFIFQNKFCEVQVEECHHRNGKVTGHSGTDL